MYIYIYMYTHTRLLLTNELNTSYKLNWLLRGHHVRHELTLHVRHNVIPRPTLHY